MVIHLLKLSTNRKKAEAFMAADANTAKCDRCIQITAEALTKS
jgi:hypothetical protein